MATMVADPIFVDTNILVYSVATQSPFHGRAVFRLQGLAAVGHPLWTSRQVIREYLAVMSRPGTLTVPVPMRVLIHDVGMFLTRFNVAEDGASVTTHLVNLLASIPPADDPCWNRSEYNACGDHLMPSFKPISRADLIRAVHELGVGSYVTITYHG